MHVNCLEILQLLKLDAPPRTLSRFPLSHTRKHKTDYVSNSSINHIVTQLAHTSLRFFYESSPTLKENIS